MNAKNQEHLNRTSEQPRIEIIGDRTVLYFKDGRTSVLRGTLREDVTPANTASSCESSAKMAPRRDSLTRSLALGLSVVTGVKAVLQMGMSGIPRKSPPSMQQIVSQLIASITLRAYRRPQKALSHERDTAGPSEAAYSRAEITPG